MLGDGLVENRLLRSSPLVAVNARVSARQRQLSSSLAHAVAAASRVPSVTRWNFEPFSGAARWRTTFSLPAPRSFGALPNRPANERRVGSMNALVLVAKQPDHRA
jgi:hypothetical protein